MIVGLLQRREFAKALLGGKMEETGNDGTYLVTLISFLNLGFFLMLTNGAASSMPFWFKFSLSRLANKISEH